MFSFLDILKMSKNENPRPTFYKVFKNGLKRVYILLVEYYKKGLNGPNEVSSTFIYIVYYFLYTIHLSYPIHLQI
jgi:hypothetical protein